MYRAVLHRDLTVAAAAFGKYAFASLIAGDAGKLLVPGNDVVHRPRSVLVQDSHDIVRRRASSGGGGRQILVHPVEGQILEIYFSGAAGQDLIDDAVWGEKTTDRGKA